ncbi:hypothetical protein [Fundicoccus culcitae]|uniref:Uncharacterized protein n=1 Tax=Fundicoccus culcitae TaxID=2969821 RepID=A0ABY5P3K9_9LACT|nr:hypothetical protein [Fundicoccus culcitae]UUX33149.1 hypothetical protein NRE15_09570 [Fundicoccus culcitae]
MALKDEDFLLKQTKDIDKAMEDLGLVYEDNLEDEREDPVDQYDFDLDSLEEKKEAEKPAKKKPFWKK